MYMYMRKKSKFSVIITRFSPRKSTPGIKKKNAVADFDKKRGSCVQEFFCELELFDLKFRYNMIRIQFEYTYDFFRVLFLITIWHRNEIGQCAKS